MTKFAWFAGFVCAAFVWGCGAGKSGPATDYAPAFAGDWSGTLVVSADGFSQSYTAAFGLKAQGLNALELTDFCPDLSGPSASVTTPSQFQIGSYRCPSIAAGSCAGVVISVQRGYGSLDATGKTLTFAIDANESGCGASIPLTLRFTGQRYDPPPVVSVTISPAAPLDTDDLIAVVTAHDPDGDPVTLSYAWERNGVAIPDQTGATLPAASTRPGDYVTVQVTASDGASTAFATASVYIPGSSFNRPPAVSVALSPANPRPSDVLTAQVTASDPDGDPLTLSYAWKVAGTLVAGETGATLPGGHAAVGDLVTVVVTASDGVASTTATASVTLPPFILLGSPPAQIAAGQGVSFQLTASSVDGSQPGAFALEYGPAGMTVSPAGLVSWPASLPMFDRSLDVHYAVTLAGSPTSRFTGTLQVVDPARQPPLYRTGIEIPVWHSGLRVADLDGDGRAEMLVASGSGLYELARSGSGYAQRWAYPFSPGDTDTVQAVAVRDLDGDGKPEIFFSTGDLVVELDGASRREVGRYESGGAFACRDLELADVDRDGAVELVCLGAASTYAYETAGKVVVFDAKTLAVRWQTASLSSIGGTLAVGDVDGDAALEIVTSGGYVFDGITQQNEWAYGPGFGRAVGVGDLDGDGVAEIVGMQDWNAFDIFSAVLKSPLKEGTGFDFDALLVADLDGDGRAEILIGDGQWGNVTAYRYDRSSNALSTLFQINSQNHGVTSLGVGDVDGDGANEFVWGSGATSSGEDSFVIAGLDPTIAVEWTNTNPNELDGPFVGARPAHLGAGADRLLFAVASTNSSYDGTRVIALDPATGLFQVSQELGTNWNRRAALDVADYDGDGVDEVLLGTSALYDGYFTAFDFSAGAAEWTSAKLTNVAVAAVTHADLNGDGYADLVAVTGDGYVRAHDVKHQALLWTSTGLGSNGVDVAVADLDADGSPEIVALASGRVVVYRRTAGTVAWIEAASQAVTGGAALLVGDADGDGTPEIYVLQSTYGGATVLRFSAALVALGSLSLDAPVQSLHLEDLGYGRKNLVVSVGSPGAYPTTTTRPRLVALDPLTGAEIWRSPTLWGTVPNHSLSYVDVNGDGRRELAFGTTYGMYLTR
ncbi:FG-GAP-like repeat-containing protein [Anaeromyxobacter diazotrophicus]|uniref:FG-GAP repeat protein n=1 Tax=Anaeromyxobacter diazotrophicus TaxID=2590199 RepID=A0A7I9VN00_9BACT|nr:FG-GAP-like repeat-containing protein [Anaeromyxobacter diazotrophicus]GEJ57761.1 hypothetical protein AMYX_25020 [Anaeromyxobacter diazotrophicus]